MKPPFSHQTALSPVDGRYGEQLGELSHFFSEHGLNKYRISVELKYLIFILKKVLKKKITRDREEQLLKIATNFDLDQAERLKQIEDVTRHDVKAIEYYLGEKLTENNFGFQEYLHIGLTSEDTNSLAYGWALKDCLERVVLPSIGELVGVLASRADRFKDQGMVARTHGQYAVPTTLGKELMVFALRVHKTFGSLKQLPIEAKLSGAVGTYSALGVAFPDENWLELSEEFIHSFGLIPNHFTTQILPPESYLSIFQHLIQINSILLDLNQDLWRYISDGILVQQMVKGEVGSSTMPHKVNPIDFENSEGNLGVANALLSHFCTKLPISRLQRDLSDSTVKRNIGVALAHCVLGYSSCTKGLGKVSPNVQLLKQQLMGHWEIISEGLQMILRTNGETKAYEKLQAFTQGKQLSQAQLKSIIKTLDVPKTLKQRLLSITPENYIGLSQELVIKGLQEIYEHS